MKITKETVDIDRSKENFFYDISEGLRERKNMSLLAKIFVFGHLDTTLFDRFPEKATFEGGTIFRRDFTTEDEWRQIKFYSSAILRRDFPKENYGYLCETLGLPYIEGEISEDSYRQIERDVVEIHRNQNWEESGFGLNDARYIREIRELKEEKIKLYGSSGSE